MFDRFVQVNIGPFTLVKTIDKFTEAFAEMLCTKGRSLSLSTKNIGERTHTHTRAMIETFGGSWLSNLWFLLILSLHLLGCQMCT